VTKKELTYNSSTIDILIKVARCHSITDNNKSNKFIRSLTYHWDTRNRISKKYSLVYIS